MKNFRETFASNLKEHFDANPDIYTAWEGGSAATGFLDEWSDIDVYVICDDNSIETVITQLEEHLDRHYTLRTKFRMPEPTWHGHAQCFYQVEHSPPLFYIDILFMKLSSKNRFSESDRHGQGQLWFDKKSLFDTTPISEEEMIRKGKITYKMIKTSFEFVMLDIRKHILRRNIMDALDMYNKPLFTRLAYAMNLKYRPAKYDFGFRYANRDYPREEIAWLEEVMFVANLDQLQRNVDIVEQRLRELLDELREHWE